MDRSPLSALFEPRSVAVFGASPRVGSLGNIVFANLRAAEFGGDLIPVNPHHSEVGGVPCVAALSGAGRAADLAVIATPAQSVEAILQDCGRAGVGAAIVLSAGFGESGEDGRHRQSAVTAAARAAGVRLLGPNCIGLTRPGLKLNATFLPVMPPAGGLALVSQSGAVCAAVADGAPPNHLGFSAVVSLGNAADLDVGEVIGFLADDLATTAILLYIEAVRDAPRFVSALRRAARTKPVVVLKAGRGAQAIKAAATHTGALLGSDAVFGAVLERTGAIRVTRFDSLFAAAELLCRWQRAGGDRLAIVTNGGGAGVLAADRAEALGLDLPPLSPETVAHLDPVLPAFWSHGNPADILGDAAPARFGSAVSACLADPAFDGVITLLTPQAMTDPTATATVVIAAAKRCPEKPLLASWIGETSVAAGRKLLSAAGIPDFATPELAVEAFSHLARRERNRRLALELPGPRADPHPDIAGARALVACALSEGRSALRPDEAMALLAAFGIPTLPVRPGIDGAAAAAAADRLGYPVAVKIASPDISHKSDVGGVALGLADAAAVTAAAETILTRAHKLRPDARIEGVTVQAMAGMDHPRELLLGLSRDPVFGPVLAIGAGGIAVELLHDAAIGLPPLTSVLAERMLAQTRASALLGPFRGAPAANRAAVVDALLRLSDLACEVPGIDGLDVNPLLAGPDGVLAVDARVTLVQPQEGAAPYAHLAFAAWPRHLVRQATLRDGQTVTIRPIRPEDAAAERDFVNALSPDARRLRFFAPVHDLTPEMISRFTDIDYRDELALVVTGEEGGRAIHYAIGRYVPDMRPDSCEFAIVVLERMQSLGIGTLLVAELMARAREAGLARMYGRILAGNSRMLQVADALGFRRRMDPHQSGVVLVDVDLTLPPGESWSPNWSAEQPHPVAPDSSNAQASAASSSALGQDVIE